MEYTLTDMFLAIDSAIDNASWRSNFWSAHDNAEARDRANSDYRKFSQMRDDLISGKLVITFDVTETVTLAEKSRALTDDIGRGQREGYCKHGVYVGGIGIDWMCGECESE